MVKNNHSNLKMPFIMTLTGARGSGKTSLLINLLIQRQFYRNKFDKVYIYSPSFHLDSKYELLNLPNDQVFDEFDIEHLENLVSNCDPEQNTLIILDDCMAEKKFKSNNNDNVLNMLAIRGRHLGISILCTAQKTSGISNVIRSQTDGAFIYKPRSFNETKALYEDNSINNMNLNSFKEVLEEATKEQYSFLYINYQQNKIYNKNFKEII